MRNYLTLVLGLAVLSSPAYASRARLESLGESAQGSYYIDDARNIFLNPAQLVHYKKKLFLELGTEVAGVDLSNGNTNNGSLTALAANNRPQGGFTNTFGDYTYALYMNNNSQRANAIIAQANGFGLGTTFLAPDSTLEAFFAGEGSLNWGISLFYAGNNAKGVTNGATGNGNAASANAGAESTASLYGVRAGIDMNNLQVFTTVGINSNAKVNNGAATNNEVKGKVSVDAGVTYKMDNWTWLGKFTTYGSDVNTAATTEIRTMAYGLGAGYKKEMTKSTTMFARVEAGFQKGTVTALADNKFWNVPLVVGAETQALSWLALRGSISQSLLGQHIIGNDHNNLQGTTTVSAGMGLTFGDIQIDGLVAANAVNNADPATGLPIPGFGSNAGTNGVLNFSALMTRMALTYNF